MDDSSKHGNSSSLLQSNTTTSNKEDFLSTLKIISIVVYCVIVVLGVIGNGLVIYVTGFKMKTTVNTVWFLNLALADFLFTLFLIFTIIKYSLNNLWPFGDFMCKFNSLVQVSPMFASIFLLTAISLDRCLATWVVHWTQRKRTTNYARLLCIFIWILSLVCSIPFVMIRILRKNRCLRNADPLTTKHLAMFRFLIGFLIPFLMITCCYVAIGVRVSRVKSKRKRKMKSFRLTLAIILAFFICWLPLHINDLIMVEQDYAYCCNQKYYSTSLHHRASLISPVVVSLAYLNSCVNPVLYTFMCKDFCQKFRHSLLLVLEHSLAEEQ